MSAPGGEALLVTACVAPGETPYLAIRDTRERLLQLYCGLLAFLRRTSADAVVLCENSGTDHDFGPLREIAGELGKELEVLVFRGNEGSSVHGKGYGEGRILRHALEHSRLIRERGSFYKVTGRFFVANFDRLRELHSADEAVFQVPGWVPRGGGGTPPRRRRPSLRGWWRDRRFRRRTGKPARSHDPAHNVLTVFYKSSVPFFRTHLIDSAERVSDRLGYYLEHAYRDDLEGTGFVPFAEAPEIVGRSATKGEPLHGRDHDPGFRAEAEGLLG